MLRTQNLFKNFMYFAFDALGKGEIFLENFRKDNPDINIVPIPPSSKSKAQRIFDDLNAPLRKADLMISDDEDSEFLRGARNFLRRYPNVPHKAAKAWDIMDAIYMAYMAANGEIGKKEKKPRQLNPYRFFGAKFDRH